MVSLSNQQPANYGTHDGHQPHQDEGQLEGVHVRCLELADDIAHEGGRRDVTQPRLFGAQDELAPAGYLALRGFDATFGKQAIEPSEVEVQQNHGKQSDPHGAPRCSPVYA